MKASKGSWFRNRKLRVKMLLGFGTVLVLFTIGMGIYQYTVTTSTKSYNHLIEIDEAIAIHAAKVESLMLQCRRNEKDFLLSKDLKYLERLEKNISALKKEAESIVKLAKHAGHGEFGELASEIIVDADAYAKDFKALVAAWERRGLDQNSGLQGQFRAVVHDAMEAALTHKVDDLMVALLQMRRYEKDYVRTKSESYKEKFLIAIEDYRSLLGKSTIEPDERPVQKKALDAYARAFNSYLAASGDADSQNKHYQTMQSAAHEIEGSFGNVYVPNAMELMLAIRRHEKDYLLRLDKKYVKRVHDAADNVVKAFKAAGVAKEHIDAAEKEMGSYKKHFADLVAEDDKIIFLTASMRASVHKIEPKVENIIETAVENAKSEASETTRQANRISTIAAVAGGVSIILGFVLALTISNALSRPIKQLSGWAKRVALGDLTLEDIKVPNDEIGEMNDSFRYVVDSFQKITDISKAIAIGDFSKSIEIKSENDMLGKAVNLMGENLRAVVRQADTVARGDYSTSIVTHSDRDELGLALINMTRTLRDETAKNEEAMEEAQKLIGHLNNLPTPILAVDKHYKIAYINPSGAAIPSLSPEECIGRHCYDLFMNPHCRTAKCRIAQAMRNDRVETAETIIDPEGMSIPVRYTGAPVKDANGDIVGGLEYIVDITDTKKAIEDIQKRDWLSTGETGLSDRMRGEQNIANLAHNIIGYLTGYLNAQIGAIYLADENNILKLMGSYAYTKRKNFSDQFKFGEGIAGQAAIEKKNILIANVPDDYIIIASGLGEAVPRNILVVPFLFDGNVKGVLELGSFNELTDLQMEFLDRVAENIGIAFHTAEAAFRNKELLEETTAQAEELQTQQEELRAINEDLEEQTKTLKASEEELQAQQEELRVANEELHEHSQSLEKQGKELKRKNIELGKAQTLIEQKARDLEISGKYKSEFLANMSHELRTPLNSILILSKLLLENKESNLKEKQVEFASTINSSGNDLLNLVNDVLDLSKVEAGRIEIIKEDMRLGDFSTGMEESFRHVAKEKGLGFKIELADGLPDHILTDRQRVEQIVNNLLSNAFKFAEEGKVTLGIQRPEEDTDLSYSGLDPARSIAIAVSDTGTGITEDQQKIIFEAFQQADGTTSRKFGGTGLGLSISRELAKLLGGEIRLKSIEGQGSTFTLYLPEVPGEAKEEEQKPVEADRKVEMKEKLPVPGDKAPELSAVRDDRRDIRPGDKSVLVIEDDPVFAKVLLNLAHEKGLKCLIAGDGETGLHFADYHNPAGIILDIELPGIDGLAVMARLRENPITSHIPVHIISSSDKTSKAMNMGAIDYLTKPVGMEKLKEVFQKIECIMEENGNKQREFSLVHDKESALRGRNILVIDDDMRNVFALTSVLEEKGMNVLAGKNGKEGMKHLEENSDIDLVIMDIMMPEMDGYVAMREIRDSNSISIRDVPIIALTAKAMRGDRSKCIEAGANDYLAKPVDNEKLLSLIRVWMSK